MSEGFYKGDTFRSSVDDTWTTPLNFFDKLNDEFDFGLDAAALSTSTLVPSNWYGPDHPDDEKGRDAEPGVPAGGEALVIGVVAVTASGRTAAGQGW